MPITFFGDVYGDAANEVLAPAAVFLLPPGLANSLLILGFGALVMWACSLLWRFKMVSALRIAFDAGQIIRIDSAGPFLANTEHAVRVSNVMRLLRESPRSVFKPTPKRVEQLYSPIDVRSDCVRFPPNEILFPIITDVPVTVISIQGSIEQILDSIASFSDLKRLQSRPDRTLTPYPQGINTVRICIDHTIAPVIVLISESILSTAHLFVIQNGAVRRHLFIAGSNIVDVSEIFGQDGDNDCVICMSERKSVILLPCLHMCVCPGCNTQIARCPVCRSPVERFLSEDAGRQPDPANVVEHLLTVPSPE